MDRNADHGPDALKSSKVRECHKSHKGLHWERELIVQANLMIRIRGKIDGLGEWSGALHRRHANSLFLTLQMEEEQPCLTVVEDMLSPGKCI